MKTLPKIIVIVGQTATGKSSLAVSLARKFGDLHQSNRLVGRTLQSKVLGEIISADSRQVYKGLDIGTGKITKSEMKGIPHHLLDIISAKRTFTASSWQKLAKKKIKEIIKRGNIPIIVGGTGLYIKSIVNNVVYPEVPPNTKLRKELAKLSTEQLFKKLQKLDPRRAKEIDAQNPVRLIRAIEIAQALGIVPHLEAELPSGYDVFQIGLALTDEKLKENIHTRLLARMKKGMVKEAEKLHAEGLSWKRMRELGLEYRFLADYLTGVLTKKEMIEKLEITIWQYAKRQKTWFKRDENIIWFNAEKKKNLKEIELNIKDFLLEELPT